MNQTDMIRTVIIDDNKDFIFSLKEHLSFFPEVEICGEAFQYTKAKSLLINKKPDLVFLDIEMPCKNGFELLQEVREQGCGNLSVIFFTAYNKYLIQALRESAFDFILKPVNPDELSNAIERFQTIRKKRNIDIQPPLYLGMPGMPQIVALPTSTGIRFVDKNCIIVFQCQKEEEVGKPVWKAILNNFAQIKLRSGTTAREIVEIMDPRRFILINQSTIVNICYLASVEFKSRECTLVPPYNEIQLIASRTQISELREKFDLL